MELLREGSFVAAREHGRVRIEGKEYAMQDGGRGSLPFQCLTGVSPVGWPFSPARRGCALTCVDVIIHFAIPAPRWNAGPTVRGR